MALGNLNKQSINSDHFQAFDCVPQSLSSAKTGKISTSLQINFTITLQDLYREEQETSTVPILKLREKEKQHSSD